MSNAAVAQRLCGAVISCAIACSAGQSAAQAPTPRVFAGAPAAPWIFPPGAGGNEFGVFHFRRVFELTTRPATFVVHVSADNRYRLFVNGEQVSSGPQRSDLMHWRYETVDLAPQLRTGRNVLAALVWNWGTQRPVAQFSRQTAFLLQGDSPREAQFVYALQRAAVPHPRGAIVVRLARTAAGGLRGEVTLPEGLTGVLEWRGKETPLRPGRQEVSF
jgi:hypothetical protein